MHIISSVCFISSLFTLHFSIIFILWIKLRPMKCWFHLANKWLPWYVYLAVVQSLSHVRLPQPHGLWCIRLPCPSLSPGVCSNLCPLSQWCHPTISSSVAPVSFWLQSFPAWGSFTGSQLFTSGGQSIGVSASASVLPMNIQGWFPLGLVSLLSKGLSRVFSSTTVWKYLHLESLSTPTPIGSSLFYPFIDN